MTFDIRFGTPVAGWLPIAIHTKEGVYSNEVSDVPDGLTQLVETLELVANQSQTSEVFWGLEPGFWRWSFIVSDGEVTLSATEDSTASHIQETLSIEGMLRVFVRALSALGEKSCWSSEAALNVDWSDPFPRDQLAAIELVLATNWTPVPEPRECISSLPTNLRWHICWMYREIVGYRGDFGDSIETGSFNPFQMIPCMPEDRFEREGLGVAMLNYLKNSIDNQIYEVAVAGKWERLRTQEVLASNLFGDIPVIHHGFESFFVSEAAFVGALNEIYRTIVLPRLEEVFGALEVERLCNRRAANSNGSERPKADSPTDKKTGWIRRLFRLG